VCSFSSLMSISFVIYLRHPARRMHKTTPQGTKDDRRTRYTRRKAWAYDSLMAWTPAPRISDLPVRVRGSLCCPAR